MSQSTELLRTLVACDSTNPSLVPGGAGEAATAQLVAGYLERGGLDVEIWDALPGRPSVLGTLAGSGGGRSLLLCSHLDVVDGDRSAFDPEIRDGRMYGRGTSDMKGGLVAAIVAVSELARHGPRLAGDVLLAGVIDEEWLSAGAVDLVARLGPRGKRVDGAILPEATGLDLVIEHGGFAWWELVSTGAEAAGDDPVRGLDAIALVGPVLTGLLELDAELASRPSRPYGRPCLHASTINGGSQLSAYPATCVVGIERCTIPGETVAQARTEVEDMLLRAARTDPRLSVKLRTIVEREAVSVAESDPIVGELARAAQRRLGSPPVIRGDMGWMDSGILVEAGIPCVAFGPRGDGEHTADEWVDLRTVDECADVLVDLARGFCGSG